MKYPKEEIKALDGKVIWSHDQLHNPQSIIDYAKWAHEQVRPRKVSGGFEEWVKRYKFSHGSAVKALMKAAWQAAMKRKR